MLIETCKMFLVFFEKKLNDAQKIRKGYTPLLRSKWPSVLAKHLLGSSKYVRWVFLLSSWLLWSLAKFLSQWQPKNIFKKWNRSSGIYSPLASSCQVGFFAFKSRAKKFNGKVTHHHTAKAPHFSFILLSFIFTFFLSLYFITPCGILFV